MLFRFLLITGIIFYAIYKIGSLFFKAGAASQQLRDQQRRNFNNTTDNNAPKSKRAGSKPGPGDYIDYEEVK